MRTTLNLDGDCSVRRRACSLEKSATKRWGYSPTGSFYFSPTGRDTGDRATKYGEAFDPVPIGHNSALRPIAAKING
jgi:hypothetical protein